MRRKLYLLTGVSALLALSMACGRQSSAPTSPSLAKPVVSIDEVAGANGATLKVGTPSVVSPINDTVLADATPTLVCQPVSPTTGTGSLALAYDWEVYDAAGVK